ncbi:MAG: hypothetical protein ACE14P_14615 [Methanotrichaceae archaeon]
MSVLGSEHATYGLSFRARMLILKIAPAVILIFLAPLVAEFLLGNLPITMLSSLIALAPMYGGGALLIREVVRHSGRGWPSIILLALAYGILEEGITTQSLFNPNYLNAHLLDYGFVPALGIAVPWTLFVLTLHTVWSISVPIAIVETLFLDRRAIPWLGRLGLALTGILFAVGIIVTTLTTLSFSYYVSTASQLAGAVAVIIILIILAFRLRPASPKFEPESMHHAPNVWLVGAFSLAAGSIFMLVPHPSAWWIPVILYLVLYIAVIIVVVSWSRRSGWGDEHRLALASGALLTYAWHAFPQPSLFLDNSTIDLIGNTIFALAAIALIAVAAKRVTSNAAEPSSTE